MVTVSSVAGREPVEAYAVLPCLVLLGRSYVADLMLLGGTICCIWCCWVGPSAVRLMLLLCLCAELYENLGYVGASIKHHLVEGMRNMWQQLNDLARSHTSGSQTTEQEQLKVETGQSVGSVMVSGKGVVKHRVQIGQSVGSVVGQWKRVWSSTRWKQVNQ